jgi:hypothetical protein
MFETVTSETYRCNLISSFNGDVRARDKGIKLRKKDKKKRVKDEGTKGYYLLLNFNDPFHLV